jgi:hypothetical protein
MTGNSGRLYFPLSYTEGTPPPRRTATKSSYEEEAQNFRWCVSVDI